MSDIPINLTTEEARKALSRFVNARNAKVQADLQWLSNATEAPATEPLAAQLADKLLRRNQVLFCVGHLAPEEFQYSEIEALVRERFPISNQGAALNVTSALSELADKETGILMRNPKGDAYMLKDPAFQTIIRSMLCCADGSEQVEIR